MAAGAWYVQFRLFRTNGLLWSLALVRAPGAAAGLAPARRTPLPLATDPASSFRPLQPCPSLPTYETPLFTTAGLPAGAEHSDARAFCGFYVAKADTKLFNHASKVVLVRKEDKTVLTMVNDFEGDAKDFAVVIPVPTFLEKGQIHVGNQATVEHLDAYSAPRLVEYWDEDPCHDADEGNVATSMAATRRRGGGQAAKETRKAPRNSA